MKRLRDTTKMKLVLKGILTAEDAELAVNAGVDGIVVSNHGGRGEDSGRATIDVLPEITEAVGPHARAGRQRLPPRHRRVKALAMGANAVGVGRPYLWGLGAFGEPGVERVLELLRTEFRAAMMQCGAPSMKELTPAMVRRA